MTVAASLQRYWPFLLSGATAGLLVSWFTHNSLTDDAYISLAAGRNLAEHAHWGVVPELTANTSTSPLNVLVLGTLTWPTTWFGGADPILALTVSNTICAIIIACAARSITRSISVSGWYAAAVLVLALLNPFVLSAIGLEVLLIGAGLLSLTALALRGNMVGFGVVAGLLVLTRLDLVVCVAVVAGCTRAIWSWRTGAAFVAVAAPWYLFSWVVLGSAIPDTFLIKEGQAADVGGYDYLSGPELYFDSRPVAALAAFGPALVGVVVAVGWMFIPRVRRSIPAPLWALGIAGILYYIAYSVLDTVPYHWYYVVPTLSLGCFAVLAVGTLAARVRTERTGLVAHAPQLIAAAFAIGAVLLTTVSNTGRGMPWHEPVIFGNWAGAEDYAQMATEVGAIVGDDPVRSPGEIGALAYFCDCTIVDEFSDRGLIIVDRLQPRLDSAGTLSRLALRANYANLDYTLEPVRPMYRLDWIPGDSGGRAWTWQFDSGRSDGHFALSRY